MRFQAAFGLGRGLANGMRGKTAHPTVALPQMVDAAAGCRGLPLLVVGGETPARAKDWECLEAS